MCVQGRVIGVHACPLALLPLSLASSSLRCLQGPWTCNSAALPPVATDSQFQLSERGGREEKIRVPI